MKLYDKYPMKNGNILIAINRYLGEDDFNLMQKIIEKYLCPEDMGYSVDSLCIGGYFIKEGISIRTSSESPYDTLSFYFNADRLSVEEQQKVENWITQVVECLHKQKPLC